MTSAQLWLHISNLAHSLACRHREPSYVRPQYYAALLDALGDEDFANIKTLAMDEITEAVRRQSGADVVGEDENLLWEAFGCERIAPHTDLSKRAASFFRSFDELLVVPGLPGRVAEKARDLKNDYSLINPRALNVESFTFPGRAYENPLPPLASMVALCKWKLAKTSLEVDLWRDWLTNMVYEQVWFRFDAGMADGGDDIEDVIQESLFRVLQRLCVYQPTSSVKLERWVFNVAYQSISITLRKQRRQNEIEPPTFAEGTKRRRGSEVESAEEEAWDQRCELVEYAVTKLGSFGAKPNISTRVETFLVSVETLLGAKKPKDAWSLVSSLKALFPKITPAQIEQIVRQSGLKPLEPFIQSEEVPL